MRLAIGDRIESAPPLVVLIPSVPLIHIDLTKFDRDRKQPLVLTIEQATQLLRELDAVILP